MAALPGFAGVQATQEEEALFRSRVPPIEPENDNTAAEVQEGEDGGDADADC